MHNLHTDRNLSSINFQVYAAEEKIINLFMVEDSEIVREHLQSLLSDIPGIAVIGYAANEPDAIEGINALLPDVVTLDLRLQSGSGFKVLENVKKHHPEIKVIVLTNDDNRTYEESCMRAGADCFFDKSFQFSRVYSALWLWSNPVRPDNKATSLPINS